MDSGGARDKALRFFLAKTAGAVLLGISVVSGVLAILDVIDLRYLVVAVVALLALFGWAAAFYVTYFPRPGEESSTARLARAIGAVMPIPYLETWLSSTVLNPEALAAYWNSDAALRIQRITCATRLEVNDAELSIRLEGENGARLPVEGAPMVMFGGSVLHLPTFPQAAVSIAPDGAESSVHIRPVLDLGQLHVVKMLFAIPLGQHERFTVEHRHSWPGGMTAGEDTLWYPYAGMFRRPVERMVVRVSFHHPPAYVRGMRASLTSGRCEMTTAQPRMTDSAGTTLEWVVDDVDNGSIYGLAFRR